MYSNPSTVYAPIEDSPVTFTCDFPNVFKGMEEYESMADFIERVVRPDDEYNRRCEDLVNRLKKFLENNTGLGVKRVFVGGSVGKMTSLSHYSDVDLIVFIDDYPTMVEFQKNLDSVLQKLEQHVLHDLNWAQEVEHTRTTHHAVQFKTKLKGYTDAVLRKVDLLPALDRLDQVPMDHVYNEMKALSAKERRYYSVCFTEEQTEFVKSMPHEVRDLIRFVKYWKETNDLPVRSYFLELLVIYIWSERRQRFETFCVCSMFKRVVYALRNIAQMEITWPDIYTSTDYSPLPPKPVLLDPMNPYNNVAPSGDDLEEIVDKSIDLLIRLEDLMSKDTFEFHKDACCVLS
ncbi:2'-5'-oligoadenylate synthase 2-like [Gigantopelta aegis]|uniref:2'-5'-oligoadenylate synthase 2-like n=1 Tax=Gigantopelta aegis TaxID=1735272 RepID=UPI001B88B3A0|nr:2'-5'-oligoadenylate synthase 2-like [Gigantopelta aegis]